MGPSISVDVEALVRLGAFDCTGTLWGGVASLERSWIRLAAYGGRESVHLSGLGYKD